jgi:hypothetical protein
MVNLERKTPMDVANLNKWFILSNRTTTLLFVMLQVMVNMNMLNFYSREEL